jgi:uncharacterized phage infection (PIP) family protein YhgE
MATKKSRTRKKETRTRRQSSSVSVSIAMLEQQAEQTSERFDVLAEKFDRILSRVEELALHTTSLNSRHDTQIQVLQKQIASNETLLTQTRDDITLMTTRLSDLVSKELSTAMNEMSEAIDQLSEKVEKQYQQLDTRVQQLERWRMFLIGGGVVAGFLLSKFADNILSGMVK